MASLQNYSFLISKESSYDVIIIGAGAAGLMCAIEAGKRGRRVLLIDHANKVGKKILMSGGGRCNFTNLDVSANNYISQNQHFCKSALARYTPTDFLELVNKYQIKYYEKTLGQLFCQEKAADILTMLTAECNKYDVEISTLTECLNINYSADSEYILQLRKDDTKSSINCSSLVIASGGLSIPRMGASGFGYSVAEQFNLPLVKTSPALVALHLDESAQGTLSQLAGIAVDAAVTCNSKTFNEAILFTHKGLSGPAILQISSYWQAGDHLSVDLLPQHDLNALFTEWESQNNLLINQLSRLLPKRLLEYWLQDYPQLPSRQYSLKQREQIINSLHNWQPKPCNTDGYKTAEVTCGGVDTNSLSSKTMEARNQPGLYFIGEVVDVTGWLGGYNFQWAWASAWCAGQVV